MDNRVWCKLCKRWHYICECGHRDVEHMDRTRDCWPRKDYDPDAPIQPMADTCNCRQFRLKTEVKEIFMKKITMVIYQDETGGWRWRAMTMNNRIIADSAEAYVSKSGAKRSAKVLLSADVYDFFDLGADRIRKN
jgi:uncharacterized protein YegP (UPF0339 family)